MYTGRMTSDTHTPVSLEEFNAGIGRPPYVTPPALDNKEAVAKVKSSNGDLRIPRKATPWLLAATSAIASGLVLCAAQHPSESVRLFCAIGATVVQTFGSGISGGLGKKPKP